MRLRRSRGSTMSKKEERNLKKNIEIENKQDLIITFDFGKICNL